MHRWQCSPDELVVVSFPGKVVGVPGVTAVDTVGASDGIIVKAATL